MELLQAVDNLPADLAGRLLRELTKVRLRKHLLQIRSIFIHHDKVQFSPALATGDHARKPLHLQLPDLTEYKGFLVKPFLFAVDKLKHSGFVKEETYNFDN